MSGFFGSSVVWGNIQGDITDQTDLDNRFKISEEQWRYYELFESKTTITGSITIPTEGQILLGRYPENTSGLCVILDSNGRPLDEIAREEDGTPVTVTSLDTNGNYTLSGLPDPTPFGIVYQIRIQHQYSNNVLESSIVNAWDANEPIKNFITVGASGCDFTSLKEACESITNSALDNPYAIHAFSSEFLEDPFKIPDYTTVVLFGARVCPNLPGDFIELGINSVIRQGAVACGAISGAAIYSQSVGSVADTIRIEGSSGTGYQSKLNGQLTCLNCSCSGVENAYWADAGALVLSTVSATGCLVGMRISNSGFITGAVFGSFGGVTTDIQQDDVTSGMRFLSALVNTDKIHAENWDIFFLTYTSDKENDEAFHVLQELSVGTSLSPRETILGGGDSHTFEYVYTFDGVSTYTDQTDIATSASASTFLFDGVTANNSIYIANRYPLTYEGIKIAIDSAADLGSGQIIAEYWNGSSWVEFNGCTVQSSTPFLKFAKNYFNQTGSYHIKYNPYIRDLWMTSDPVGLGENFYWMRFRIETTITASPAIQQIKIHTNRLEVNEDGTRESHMDARVYKKLVVDAVRPIEGNMQNASIYVDENVGVGLENNRFTTANDLLGVSFELPEDCDTSSPLIFVWKGKFASTGNVDFTVRRKIVQPGDSYTNSEPGASGETLTVTTGTIAIATSNTREDFRVDIDISDAIPSRENSFGDEIWITLQYPTRGAGNFDYTKLSANYLSDFSGRHVRQ